jgi:hypothetical protein
MLIPSINHSYAGSPPLTEVAVNVTLVPLQMVVAEAEMDTDGTTFGITVIVMPPEVAVAGVAQGAEEVIIQLITSLFPRPESV